MIIERENLLQIVRLAKQQSKDQKLLDITNQQIIITT